MSGLMFVAEGIEDVRLIRTILHQDLSNGMRFYAGQGRTSVTTLARNLLVHEGGPVLIVMDADTFHSQLRQEMESLARVAMGAVAASGLFHVFTFIPDVEVVLFEAPDALAQALGRVIPPKTVEEGLLAPKIVLRQLLKAAGLPDLDALIRKLDEPSKEALGKGKQAKDLKEKVRALCRSATATSA